MLKTGTLEALVDHGCSHTSLGRLQSHKKARLGSSTRRGPSIGSACSGYDQLQRTGLKVFNRYFHDYFITHLPSTSLHSDQSRTPQPHGKAQLASDPRGTQDANGNLATPSTAGLPRDKTVVRIPLLSAKLHIGVSSARGTRSHNEDSYQAGVIQAPAFASTSPTSLMRPDQQVNGEVVSARNVPEDPQVFYFAIFDGHGGSECSKFLKDRLHSYIEDAAEQLGLRSTLRLGSSTQSPSTYSQATPPAGHPSTLPFLDFPADIEFLQRSSKAMNLEQTLTLQWADTVGGYFKRFWPEYFPLSHKSGNQGSARLDTEQEEDSLVRAATDSIDIEAVLTYAFLKADYDFVMAQARKLEEDIVQSDRALNEGEVLGQASRRAPGAGARSFKGGSTCSVALISTPTLTPYWHPESPATLITAHVGDTRILLCSTETGLVSALTTDHHPSSPVEGNRLRRYGAAAVVTDSFGEERLSGLANTRSFGDLPSKRLGVSAEPEIRRLEIRPAEYSFLTLVSDGVSGTLGDQEIADIVKESKTPDEGAKKVVSFATEVSAEGDNATCMVIRLGGWERRMSGGLGAMGTKEVREWRRQEAINPRTRRT